MITAALLVAPASCQEFFITEFNLNLENAEISLVFNYPVMTPINDFYTGLTIQSNANGSGPDQTLTGGTLLLNSFSESTITFLLTLYDLNAIRVFSMNKDSTYLSANAGIVHDHEGRPSQAINSFNALQVNKYILGNPRVALMQVFTEINTGM